MNINIFSFTCVVRMCSYFLSSLLLLFNFHSVMLKKTVLFFLKQKYITKNGLDEKKRFQKITSNIYFRYPFQNAVISLVLLSWVSKKKKKLHKRFSYRLHLRLSKHRNLFNQSLDVWKKTSKYRTKRGRQIQLPGQFVDKRIISVAVKIAFRFWHVTGIDNSEVEGFQQMLSVLCVIENQVNEKFENRQWQGKCYFNS